MNEKVKSGINKAYWFSRSQTSGSNNMKLKQYPKYKDSGVQWIGEIPEGWNNYKLKHVVNEFVAGGTPRSDDEKFWAHDEHGIPWVNIGDMTNKEIVTETKKEITVEGQADKGLRILKNGTLLYSIFASLGKVAVLGIDATTNQAILGLIISKKIDTIFLKYYLKNLEEPIITLSNANTQNNINSTIVKNIEIAIPSLSDQTAIANFLDKKTAKIDAMIEKDKKLIALLKEKRTALINHAVTKGLDSDAKMKDSGVDWIGEIPEGWRVRKLKQVTSIRISNVDKKSKPDEEEVLLCNYNEVYNNEFITLDLSFMKATASIEQINKFSIKKEDVIITKDSETPEDIAVPSLAEENLNNIVCGYHLALIRPNGSKIKGNFLLRLFQSKKINDQFVIYANGVTRFGISTHPIKNSFVIIPPLSEQTAIANFLDQATSKIDITIQKINEKITFLEEYKKSLIHHVVTGKVDVRKSDV